MIGTTSGPLTVTLNDRTTRTVRTRRIEARSFDGDQAKAYEVIDATTGQVLGVISHSRHTYRTAYAGSRIGYDRTHTCWRSNPSGLGRSAFCLRDKRDALRAVVGPITGW